MASFQPKKIVLSEINKGNRYGEEGIQPEAINAPIEASAWVQALGTNAPNVTDISATGTPSVTIEETANGTPRFKFSSLRGAEGPQGPQGPQGEGVPAVTTADNGKFLRVVGGQWVATEVEAKAIADYIRGNLYDYGTEDLTAGTSELETGKLYFVYE